MRILFVVACLCLLAAPASAQPKPIDVSQMVETMQVFHTGSGHYLVYWPQPKRKGRMFWGNGRRFVEMPAGSTGYSNKTFTRFTIYDRRMVKAYVEYDGTKANAHCTRSRTKGDYVTVPLSPVGERESRTLLKRAKFFPKVVVRQPHVLSRDALGIYYYVDRAHGYPVRDFRLFIGEAGNMKKMPIRTVAIDSVGQVFATKKGALQVKRVPKKGLQAYEWVLPNRRDKYELTSVPTSINEGLIFNTLGVYGARRIGSHCDDL